MRAISAGTIALLLATSPSGAQIVDGLLVEACTELLNHINGALPVGVVAEVRQHHRSVEVTNTEIATGNASTAVCAFRNLDDPVPELESISINGHQPMAAGDHPEWNEFIWSYFQSKATAQESPS